MATFESFILSFILVLGLFLTVGNIHLTTQSLHRCEQHIVQIHAAAAALQSEVR